MAIRVSADTKTKMPQKSGIIQYALSTYVKITGGTASSALNIINCSNTLYNFNF